ncbi:carboxylesterase family protein [Nannocystis sp. ILAH1]|uniref:carboxylesterase/lipase family protein n=1 Tax=Nannocystis sp. ILAH1 TaxID=2996789 RepID=UPI0022721CA7|nr:carboxylesterase family protein [Nannocystis sp. ILAH1]MCY0990524.1 carboxylesterase family protein [Nannocystis sp. ILAH1]
MLGFALVGCGGGEEPAGDPSLVDTEAGAVQGRVQDGVRSFLGIPYAAPPVGPLRFEPPAPHPGWDGPREALEFGPGCPQIVDGVASGEEDCLTLNVWAPDDDGAAHPVMVWIHGGGFVGGAASEPLYAGATLAREQGVVVVSLNYRLGALGWLAAPELAHAGASGNFGLRDQIAALGWVKANIAGFGGDPGRVTLFGESAGGSSVTCLLGSPAADGLYHAAIVQSGGDPSSLPMLGDPDRDPAAAGAEIVAAVGCAGEADPLACLRAVPADALVAAVGEFDLLEPVSIGPVVGDALLPEQPLTRIAAGDGPEVPLLVGANAQEFGPLPAVLPVADEAALKAILGLMFGELAEALLELYPPASFGGPGPALAALLGERTFVCPALALAAAAPQPSWSYLFAHTLAGEAGAFGSFHALEVPYVFGNLDALPEGVAPTAADEQVSAFMRDAWGRFAREGSPGDDWPAHAGGGAVMQVSTSPAATADVDAGRCAELAALGLTP